MNTRLALLITSISVAVLALALFVPAVGETATSTTGVASGIQADTDIRRSTDNQWLSSLTSVQSQETDDTSHQVIAKIIVKAHPLTANPKAITTATTTATATPEDNQSPPVKTSEDFNPDLTYWFTVLFISIAGMFGGLLFGIKDKKLVIPHRSSKNIWNPGLLTDILFGMAGGIVIYLIVPGTFDYEAGGLELVKILGIAIAGGYGGRALVERVLAQQIKDLESKVETIEEKSRWDAIAMALLEQHLDDDPDAPSVSPQELKEAILSASTRTRVLAFDKARQFRKNSADQDRPDLVEKVIPIFEALIEADVDHKYHRNHAQLAYALIGKTSTTDTDWKRALEEINEAIQIRDEQKIAGFLVYEYTRAICNIHLKANITTILADLNIALRGPKVSDWIRQPDEKYAADLIAWIRQNQTELEDWIKVNNIRLP